MRRLIIGAVMLFSTLPAAAEGIHVLSAELTSFDGSYNLSATFDVDLTPTLEEALNKGLALHFVVEFELIYPRWYTLYVWNQRVAELQQRYRLTYNALTQQYRLSFGALHQNFDTVEEALALLGRIRGRAVFGDDQLAPGRVYEAQIRLRLDTAQLPKPFQINALGSRDWNLASNWYRWTVTR